MSVHLKEFEFTLRMYGYLGYLFQEGDLVVIEFTDQGDINDWEIFGYRKSWYSFIICGMRDLAIFIVFWVVSVILSSRFDLYVVLWT